MMRPPIVHNLHAGSIVSLYVIAGVATSPDFMEGLRVELERRYLECTDGKGRIRSMLLHPYGTWDRGLWPQLRDARRDLRHRVGRRAESLGGRYVLQRVEGDGAAAQGPLWLVGHSGGGVAAVHAAELLTAGGTAADCRIVQIGSPRCAVAESMRARTAYLYAVRAGSRRAIDPICRLGTWGGWERTAAGWPRWNPLLYAPDTRIPLPIVGGHADYFREGEAYRQAGGSDGAGTMNLQLSVDAMWDTLAGLS